MALIKSKRYPEFYTYVGSIHHTTIEYQIPRIPGLTWIANRIITEAVEYEINKGGGELLEVAIYSENTWYSIIPTYTIKTEFKWYLPGELTLGFEERTFSVTAIIIAIVALIGILFGFYYTKRHYDTIEQHGWPPWYESIFGKVALVLIVGAGAYAIVKLTPYLYQKIYKEKKT